MLLNIPIIITYCWVAIILLGTMRITFINETDTTINDINIIGCGGGHIEKLTLVLNNATTNSLSVIPHQTKSVFVNSKNGLFY